MINLDWACVDSIQRHNFDLLAADVEANLLCKGVNPGLSSRRRVSILCP